MLYLGKKKFKCKCIATIGCFNENESAMLYLGSFLKKSYVIFGKF